MSEEIKDKSNQIENVLKPKNKALKAKLSEKLNTITSIESNFNNVINNKNLEILELKRVNSQLSEERNLIIKELITYNIEPIKDSS